MCFPLALGAPLAASTAQLTTAPVQSAAASLDRLATSHHADRHRGNYGNDDYKAQ